MSTTYRAIEVLRPGEFSEVRKPLLDPGPNQVRIRVEACGVCHSDAATVDGLFPIAWPRVPGHEVAHEVDVAPVLEAQRALFGPVQHDRLSDEMAVGDAPAGAELLLAPAVEEVASAGPAFEPGHQRGGLPLDELLRLAIAGVVHDGKVQAQALVHVPHLRPGQPSLDERLHFARADEMPDRLLELVFT